MTTFFLRLPSVCCRCTSHILGVRHQEEPKLYKARPVAESVVPRKAAAPVFASKHLSASGLTSIFQHYWSATHYRHDFVELFSVVQGSRSASARV